MQYKAVAPFLQGVDASLRPQVIDPSAFLLLEQFRIHRGTVTNFPGWVSILSPGAVGTFGTMLKEFITLSGDAHLLVAGPDKVYTYSSATQTVTDVSGALSFNATRVDPWWPFFFNDSMYFTQINDGLHKWSSGAVAAVPLAPKARVGGVVAAHLCLFNTSDAGGTHPQRFHWAAEATDDVWDAAPNNDAGFFDIVEGGDVGIGALPIQDDLALYKELAIVQITFIGGNEVFGRRYTIRNVGLLAAYAVVDIGGEHLFMGQDTFYTYSGGNINNEVGLKIKDRVYGMLNLERKERIRSTYIHETREALFFFPSNTASGPDADKCVVYNVQDKIWYGPFDIKCSMAGRTSRNVSIVVNDVLDIVDDVFILVNAYPTGSDEHPRTLFIDDVGDMHEIGITHAANGEAISRTLETGDQYLGITATDGTGAPIPQLPEAVFQVAEVNFEFNYLQPNKRYDFWLGHRMSLQTPVTYDGPYKIFGSQTSGRIKVPVRATGRWFRIRIVAPNSRRMILAGYQYGYNMVGRR